MFAPSVAARALTMKQALLVAAVFEFTGAVLMVRRCGCGAVACCCRISWPRSCCPLAAVLAGRLHAHRLTCPPPSPLPRPHQGAGVVDTIRSGITNINYFYDSPDVLAYGAQQRAGWRSTGQEGGVGTRRSWPGFGDAGGSDAQQCGKGSVLTTHCPPRSLRPLAGMLCAMAATGIWMLLATYWEVRAGWHAATRLCTHAGRGR